MLPSRTARPLLSRLHRVKRSLVKSFRKLRASAALLSINLQAIEKMALFKWVKSVLFSNGKSKD
ncbi:exported hypothetical protein [Bradyrhizobium sp. STM 3843]|nr:exported hypothetical protein [Bradyrhizobium sp. STM 3843]